MGNDYQNRTLPQNLQFFQQLCIEHWLETVHDLNPKIGPALKTFVELKEKQVLLL